MLVRCEYPRFQMAILEALSFQPSHHPKNRIKSRDVQCNLSSEKDKKHAPTKNNGSMFIKIVTIALHWAHQSAMKVFIFSLS